jgi:protein TonB
VAPGSSPTEARPRTGPIPSTEAGRSPLTGGGRGEVRGDAAAGGGGAPGTALTLGTGGGAIPPEYGPYLQRFRRHVQESLVYPLAARRQSLRGTVELDVTLDPGGRVRDVHVARSSSHGVLDDAALDTVRRLDPLPPPESLPRRPLLIRLPLIFDLR